tara:strand:- start:2128 stop:3963 length:1836 start_codon:yes stop_codon:yes gene_type:complete
MCGIAGLITSNLSSDLSSQKIKSTLKMMAIRGPDFQKHVEVKINNNLKFNLFHSRLAIIDPKSISNQPFEDESGILSFNGEIYNYIELRKSLIKKGYKFKTNSDTEVLSKMLDCYGDQALDKLDGMWSFFYYSKKNKIILISRDRFGEKPFYFYKSRKNFYFGSNINYIKNLIGNKLSLNNLKLKNYLYYGFRYQDINNETFFKNIIELEKSHFLKIDQNFKIIKKRYWKPNNTRIIKGLDYQRSVEKLREIVLDTINTRLRADVKIACLLSGGIDSTALAMVASKKFKKNIKLYSIRSNDLNYDEQNFIDLIVKKSSLKHEYIDLKVSNNTNYLEGLIKDANSPLLAVTFYLYALINRKIKKDNHRVLFSGIGADEMFAGYYTHFLYYLKSISKEKTFKKNLLEWKKHISKNLTNKSLKNIEKVLKTKLSLNQIIGNDQIKNYFKKNHLIKEKNYKFNDDFFKNTLSKDMFVHVTSPQLRDSDQISMFNSIENRSPFLSKKIYEFSFSLPNRFLIEGGYNKKILRDAMKNFLPPQILNNRNKVGFNANTKNVFNFRDKNIRDVLFSNNYLNNLINMEKVEMIIKAEKITNNESHFLFSLLNSAIFLNQNY